MLLYTLRHCKSFKQWVLDYISNIPVLQLNIKVTHRKCVPGQAVPVAKNLVLHLRADFCPGTRMFLPSSLSAVLKLQLFFLVTAIG